MLVSSLLSAASTYLPLYLSTPSVQSFCFLQIIIPAGYIFVAGSLFSAIALASAPAAGLDDTVGTVGRGISRQKNFLRNNDMLKKNVSEAL
jgi:hypothetical protein